ncbi:hypothetical protein PACTADRAFT_47671 [Pachysolen tannophilus NRRL Y-2460]|uniref:Glycosyltransferase family 15 protein n=1 Tax=Pachysolen tannophilus NRRL Y-2460 TaxID=669874 RepID=A0A1E4U1E7_PACTA|nr:hypothetical protein PACTADRAFT_47671 [Pachysolen tannophilus NRRL Y-2460]
MIHIGRKRIVRYLVILILFVQILVLYHNSHHIKNVSEKYFPSVFNNLKYPFLTSTGELNLAFFKFRFEENITVPEAIERNIEIYTKVMEKKISEPKVNDLKRPTENYQLANATLFSLVRNSELKGIVPVIIQIEEKFNNKFHYPWTFLNDEPFTDDFKTEVLKHTKSNCFFEVIPKEYWNKPSHIDPEKEKKGIKKLQEAGVPYADKDSYHNMCRFNSGTFYNIPHMKQFKWYWRIEPDTRYYCHINYDVFKFMEDHNKTYGFNINVYDVQETIETLWTTTLDFLKEHPQYLHPEGAYDWLLEDLQYPIKAKLTKGYSTCHFWSNFEIANLDFFRGEQYSQWFEHLDKAGGFYYERWGDAPVHSMGLALFEDKSKIHWFRDIGYQHSPYINCPNSDQCGDCTPAEFCGIASGVKENCMANWIKYEMSDEQLAMY